MTDTMIDSLTPLAQADLLLLTARLFSSPVRRPPDDLVASDHDLAALAERANGAEAARLAESLRAALGAVQATERVEWSGEYTRLFDASISCPINETGYVRRDKGAIIADLCGFYLAFGFEPDETSGEKADQLVCELEFAALLMTMIAQARRLGNREAVETTEAALRAFLVDHLGEWITLFCHRLLSTTTLPFYVHAADLLVATWDTLAAGRDVPCFDQLDKDACAVEVPDDGTPYECGMAEAETDALVTLTGPPGSGLPQN